MSDFTRKHNTKVIDNKKYEFGIDGDTYYDEKEYGVKLKGSKDDITVLARKKYVDTEIATLKKYVDDENQKQDVKIDKNTADIVDLSTRVTTNESEISELKNEVSLLDTTIVSTEITLTPISEIVLNPRFVKAVFTVTNKDITAIHLYIQELKTTINDITTGNDLKFNVSITIPEGYTMSTDRYDFICVSDSGGNTYLSAQSKRFISYSVYTNNLNINDESVSFDLVAYSDYAYSNGNVNLFDIITTII